MTQTLVERLAIIILNGQDTTRMTNAKKIGLRCLIVASFFDDYLAGKYMMRQDEIIFTGLQDVITENTFHHAVLTTVLHQNPQKTYPLGKILKKITHLSSQQLIQLEKRLVSSMRKVGTIKKVSSIENCDRLRIENDAPTYGYYVNNDTYQTFKTTIHETLHHSKELQDDDIILFWLLSESGCMYDLFTIEELEMITPIYQNLPKTSELANNTFTQHISNHMFQKVLGLFHLRSNAIEIMDHTPFLFLERAPVVFIQLETYFERADERLDHLRKALDKKEIDYTVLRTGKTPLIKVYHYIYEAIPDAPRRQVGVSCYGVKLRKYPFA